MMTTNNIFSNNSRQSSPKPSAKDRILDTAHTLFYQNGIRATGVDRLISESGVTKTTFYRHFPSKNQLILAFLEHRHQYWINWFTTTLTAHGNNAEAICPALEEWLNNEEFRGCAFINSVSELGEELPAVIDLSYQHKQDMAAIIEQLLPASKQRKQNASAIALALDGAIIHTQFGSKPDVALASLKYIIKYLP